MAHFHMPSQAAATKKTGRGPNEVNERVEAAIQGKDCTFSAFVIAAVRAALDDLEDEGEPGHPDKP